MRVNQVNQRAEPSQAIPSMGGRQLADFLYRAARQLPGRGCVVECGSWLGASIAPVAEGMRDAGSSAVIHCFDRWRATREEVRKAAAQGVTLREGQDLLPLFMANILPIYPHIVCHQGWTREATWHSDPIELYIDDCNKAPEDFEHALATFGRAWKPEETLVVLMDYDFYRKPHLTAEQRERYSCQRKFVERNADCFEQVAANIGGTSAVVFRYITPWTQT